MSTSPGWKAHLDHNLRCVRDAMQEQNITSAQLAKELDANQFLLDKVLAGTHVPSKQLGQKIADRLGLMYFAGRLSRIQ